MRSRIWSWGVFAAVILLQAQLLEAQQKLPSTGRILVLSEPDAIVLPPGETVATADRVTVKKEKLHDILKTGRVKRIKQLFPGWKPKSDLPEPVKVRIRKKGDTVMPDEISDLSYWHVLEVSDTSDMETMVTQLNAAPGVVSAEPDGYIEMLSTPTPFPGLFSRLSRVVSRGMVLSPNDPYFPQQWGLYNPTNRAADIRAPEAWNIQTGRPGTRIAILDTGIEQTNADFAGGVIVSDYDFVNNDGNSYPDTDFDKPYHGTAVAGIAAARTNEGVGAAGVCGGSGANLGCSLLIAKISGSLTLVQRSAIWLGLVSVAASGTNWALTSGASVINNSWCADRGVFGIDKNRSVHDAMRNAYQQGALVVAAMGNSNGQCSQTSPTQQVAPAAWSDIVMSVGASTRNGTRVDLASTGNQWQSATGPHISVLAPGLGSYAPTLGGPPTGFSGTSEATPFVSGVAGLIRSEATAKAMQLTDLDIRRIIEGTALNKGVAGYDDSTGWGLVDAEKALKSMQAPNELLFATLAPATSTCFAQTGITNWTFWADWAVVQARRCELRRAVTFPKKYTTTPLVWGRPITNGGITPSNPNSQVYFTGVLPGSATATGVTLRTYVYERWSLTGTFLGWYPVQPSQVNWAYGVLGQPAPVAPFTVTAGAPNYITVKATYPLTGSANYPASGWRWDRGDDGAPYTLWANAQNTQFVAYAGDYTIGWRLFARRNSDAVTAYGYNSTTVCIQSTPCGGGPLAFNPIRTGLSPSAAAAQAPVAPGRPTAERSSQPPATSRVVAGHFGAGPWLSRDGDQGAIQLYSLWGRHDAVTGNNSWANSFALREGIKAQRTVARPGGTISVTEMRTKPSPDVSVIRLATDPLKEAGAYWVSYALDPDLGARPEDDKLTWIDSAGAVVVADPDSGVIAYGWSGAPTGARATVREYASADGLLQPETGEQAYQEQRADSRVIGKPGDVRFALSLGPVALNASGRLDATLISASGRNTEEAIANLLNERRRAPEAATIALDAGSSTAPQSFALRQTLGRANGAAFATGRTEGTTSLTARAQLRQFGITALEYAVASGQSADVHIRVYSSSGQLVRNLVREQKSAGEYYVEWDGLNERGERVAPGVYVAVMEAGTFKATRKLVITQ
jgi:subtilisin family serine protease